MSNKIPWLDWTGVKSKVTPVQTDDAKIIEHNGEMYKASRIRMKEVRDTSFFVKFYEQSFPVLCSLLNSRQLQVFVNMAFLLRPNNISIYYGYDTFKMSFPDLHKSTYYNVINRLIEVGAIEKSDDAGVFLINPSIVFNGKNRHKFIRQGD